MVFDNAHNLLEIQGLHIAGCWCFAVVEHVAMLVQTLQVVKVIDHQAVRLLDAFGGRICKPVDALNARTVAQMEAGHGVEHLLAVAALSQIVRGATGLKQTQR